jgi:hypothetical protein
MHGLYLLWWVQEKEMPVALVAAILAAGDLAVAAFEVPTGWFADRFGHRLSLITGSLVQIAGMLFCWLGEGPAGLLAASALVALADGFRSGADQALLYRSCCALGREHEFQRLEARARALQTVALVAMVVAGGAMVQSWGFAVGWAAEVLCCVAGLAMACVMVEPPASGSPSDGAPGEAAGRGGLSHRASLLSPRMGALILPAAFLGAASGAASFLAQTAGPLAPAEATLIVAAMAFAEAAGSVAAMRLPAASLRGQSALAAAGLACLAIAALRPAVFLAMAVALSCLAGLAGPLRAAAIQRLAADGVRARAASLASACDMVLSTIALPLAGLAQRGRSRRRS